MTITRKFSLMVLYLFFYTGFNLGISNAHFTQIQDLYNPDTSFAEIFEIDGINYLGVASVDFFSEQTSIQIYKWNVTSYEEYQLISLNTTISKINFYHYNDITYFVINDFFNMIVYQWNQGQFTEYMQLTIPETFAPCFFFYINDLPFIVISSTDDRIYIYQWTFPTGFMQKQYFIVKMADIKSINVNGNSYIIAYENGITPKLYKWLGTMFRPSNDFILPQENSFFSNQFKHDNNDYFIFKNFGDFTENDIFSYGVYQWNNSQFSEVFKNNLISNAFFSYAKINNNDFLTISMLNDIEIYKWNNLSYELYDTINCIYPCNKTKNFSINQDQYVITHYTEPFDPNDPFKLYASGIYVYQRLENKKIVLEDVICSLKILSGFQCDYKGPDIDNDNITGIKEILYNLYKIAH